MGFRRAKPGGNLQIEAQAFNTMCDAAESYRSRYQASKAIVKARPIDVCTLSAFNDGPAVQAGAVLGIDGVVISPQTDVASFHANPLLRCSTPSADNHRGKFVITMQPIAEKSFGRVIVAGMATVMINSDDADPTGTTVGIVDGQSGYLGYGDGPATVLYRESGTGPKWGIVRFGGGGQACAYAKMIECPDENRICKVHKMSGTWDAPTEGTEDIEAYAPPGCFTRMPSAPYCELVPIAGMSPPYMIRDIFKLDLRVPATGEYTANATNTLAPYQDEPDPESCTGGA